MKYPFMPFPLKWNDAFDEPEINQAEFRNFRITYNPDVERFHVEQQDKMHPSDWHTLGTYKLGQKGHDNAVQRMRREIRKAENT